LEPAGDFNTAFGLGLSTTPLSPSLPSPLLLESSDTALPCSAMKSVAVTEYLHTQCQLLALLRLLFDKETLFKTEYEEDSTQLELAVDTLKLPKLIREAKDGMLPTKTTIDPIHKNQQET
jgi:hypothetical protein